MPHVSRNKLSQKAERELLKNLNSVITTLNDPLEMDLFIDALLTDTEKLMLAKRLAIVVLLEENISDTHIASTLHVTRITVAKMRYYYEARGGGFKVALQKLEEQKKLDDFKQTLLSLVQYTMRAASGSVKPSILD